VSTPTRNDDSRSLCRAEQWIARLLGSTLLWLA
jgi:hypothetical protein